VNTIRKPRKRPRDKSISFRTFWWVLQREAFMRITDFAAPTAFTDRLRRRALCDRTARWVRDVAESFMRQNPERRFRK